ncbi:MAG: zinc-ribbon domain-containing protein [Saezia sp.]
MTLELPQNAGHALRHAPEEQQQKILAVLADWPSNVGQSTPSYSKALYLAVGRLVKAWDGVWLNPDEGTRRPKLQCAKGHTLISSPYALRQGIWCSGCYVDSLRDSIEIMQKIAAKRHGECLSKTYRNAHTKLQWQCKEGHTWEMTPLSAKEGHWCAQCRTDERQNKYLAEIQELAFQRGGECLSKQYIDVASKMTFRCAYGHVWQTKPGCIKASKSWCPVCRYDKKKGSLTDFHVLAAAKGGLCLAKEYVSTKTPIEWQCAKGHIWEAAPSYVRLGSWCPRCAKDPFRSSIKEMQELAKSRGGQCLSTHYENARTKLLFECKLGHQWISCLNNVKYKSTWCPQCAILARCKYDKAKKKYLPDMRKTLDAKKE